MLTTCELDRDNVLVWLGASEHSDFADALLIRLDELAELNDVNVSWYHWAAKILPILLIKFLTH